jgi:glycerol-3-phosphate acyltransferase PlsY
VWLSLIPAALLGYLVGSVPSAFLLVRWKSRVDVRKHGSGNVGALNSMEVTGSRFVGTAVMLLDIAKGSLAVWLAGMFWEGEFAAGAAAGLSAVTGHNFPVWLRFHGGRGLATAAGVMFLIAWPVVVFWGGCWVVAYQIRREVNLANAAATLICLAMVLLLPAMVWEWLPPGTPAGGFRVFGALLLVLLLVKLVEPVLTYFRTRKGS